MKRYYWKIELSGLGDTEGEAWEDLQDSLAVEGLGLPAEKPFHIEEED